MIVYCPTCGQALNVRVVIDSCSSFASQVVITFKSVTFNHTCGKLPESPQDAR